MRMIFALCYAFAVSVSGSAYALLAAAVLPVVLVCRRKLSLSPLRRLNMINLAVIITLALTWPVMTEGIIAGIVIALRVNMIYIVFAALVFPQGLSAIYGLPLPEKLRVLFILTVRGINILRERLDTAMISASLRAPDAGLFMRLKIFAYVLGSVLLQGAAKSERMMIAVEIRGGFSGFAVPEREELTFRDYFLLAGLGVYVMIIVMTNYA